MKSDAVNRTPIAIRNQAYDERRLLIVIINSQGSSFTRVRVNVNVLSRKMATRPTPSAPSHPSLAPAATSSGYLALGRTPFNHGVPAQVPPWSSGAASCQMQSSIMCSQWMSTSMIPVMD